MKPTMPDEVRLAARAATSRFQGALRVSVWEVTDAAAEAAYAAGRADERARAVADLDTQAREHSSAASHLERARKHVPAEVARAHAEALRGASGRIERGEHLGD